MNMQAALFIPDIIDIEASGFGSHSYPLKWVLSQLRVHVIAA